MHRTKEMRDFYNRAYQDSDYAPFDFSRDYLEQLQQFVRDFDLNGKRVVDLGCGRGWLKHIVDGWIGIDISQNAGRYSPGKFICAEAESIPLNNGCVDFLWSINFLEHSHNLP